MSKTRLTLGQGGYGSQCSPVHYCDWKEIVPGGNSVCQSVETPIQPIM